MFEALTKQLGVITTSAKLVGISRTTHYRWLDEDSNYKAWIDEIPDITLDFAEHALHKLINEGNVAATIFYLKTKGRDRGYIERPETMVNVNKTDNKLIQVNIPEAVKELINAELQSNS